MSVVPAEVVERFMSKVNKDGPVPVRFPELGPCWLWTAGKSSKGYGQFWVSAERPMVHAHRFAFEVFVGPLEDNEDACHRCDVRPCVRPDHLFRGTHADNNHDRHTKGGYGGPGEAAPNARLTVDQVEEARKLWADRKASGLTLKDLAARYGVAKSTAYAAVSGQNWSRL